MGRKAFFGKASRVDNVIKDRALLSQWLDERYRISCGFKHRGLKRFCETDDDSGIKPDFVEKATGICLAIVSALCAARWQAHPASGRRCATRARMN